MKSTILSVIALLAISFLLISCAEEQLSQPEGTVEEEIKEKIPEVPKCSSQQIDTCNKRCEEFGTSSSPENEACFNDCIAGFNCSEDNSEDDEIYESAINFSQPAYPRKNIALYKGVLMTTILTLDHSLADREDLLAIGANTVALVV